MQRGGDEIEEAFLEIYKQLMSTKSPSTHHLSSRVLQEGVMVNKEQQSAFSAPFIGEDVKVAFFDIKDNKALGSDGYTSCFLRRHGLAF